MIVKKGVLSGKRTLLLIHYKYSLIVNKYVDKRCVLVWVYGPDLNESSSVCRLRVFCRFWGNQENNKSCLVA